MKKRHLCSGLLIITIVLGGAIDGWAEEDPVVKEKKSKGSNTSGGDSTFGTCRIERMNPVDTGTDSCRTESGFDAINPMSATEIITLSQGELDSAKRDREKMLEEMGYIPPKPQEVTVSPEESRLIEEFVEKQKQTHSQVNVPIISHKLSEGKKNEMMERIKKINEERRNQQKAAGVEKPIVVKEIVVPDPTIIPMAH